MSDSKSRILLIEDDPEFAKLLRVFLQAAGQGNYELDWTDTLEDGLSRLDNKEYQLILLDLFLPDEHGVNGVTRLVAQAPNVPVVILTGHDDELLATEALKQGAQDYIVKGKFDTQSLMHSIKYAIERKKVEEMSRQALEMEQKVTQEILEHAPIGIWKLDESLCIVQVNEVGINQVRGQRENLVGKNIFDVVLSAVPPQPVIEAIDSGQPFRGDQYKLTLDAEDESSTTWWDFAIWPVRGGEEENKGAVLMTIEVTQRVRLAQQREDFMATLAHDLKTPLIGADRALGLLIDGVLGKLQPGQEQIVSMLKHNNQSLLSMVQNLLEVYRYETAARALDFKRVDLKILSQKCVDELTAQASSRHLKLKASVDASTQAVLADHTAIRRLIINLLDNAIKFTPPGGVIEVLAAQADDTVELKIRDTGKGIDPEHLPMLFQRFWQGDPEKQYSAGTGLGLYLCRQIAEAHGGKISCASDVNHGTTFSITLPAFDESLS